MDEDGERVQQQQEEGGTEDQQQLFNEEVKYTQFCNDCISIRLLCTETNNLIYLVPIGRNLWRGRIGGG